MTRAFALPALLLAAALSYTPAALATKKVYDPYVGEGEWELEHYGTYQIDDRASQDGAIKTKTAIGHGVTDYLHLELEAVHKRSGTGHSNLKLDAIEPVAKWQLTEQGEYFVDVGLYTALELHTDNAKDDKWEAKALLGKRIGYWSHYTNLTFDQKYEGTDRNVEFELAHSTTYRLNSNWLLAGEAFLDFKDMDDQNRWDDQDHRIGAELTYEIPNVHAKAKLGYLAGISDGAPDNTLKWFIEYEW